MWLNSLLMTRGHQRRKEAEHHRGASALGFEVGLEFRLLLPGSKETTFPCPTSFLYKTESMISAFCQLPRDEQGIIETGVSHPTAPLGNSEERVAPKSFPQHAAIIKVSSVHPLRVLVRNCTRSPCWQGLGHKWVRCGRKYHVGRAEGRLGAQ